MSASFSLGVAKRDCNQCPQPPFSSDKMPILNKSDQLTTNRTTLRVKTDMPFCIDNGTEASCESSPLPPALSPINASPHSPPVYCNNNSPSPPLIIAEIPGCTFNSSSTSFDRLVIQTNSPVNSNSIVNRLSTPKSLLKAPEKCNQHRQLPRCLDSSSSTTSYSSSSSNVSPRNRADISTVNRVSEPQPILEKISVSLGSPKITLCDVRESLSTNPTSSDKTCLASLLVPGTPKVPTGSSQKPTTTSTTDNSVPLASSEPKTEPITKTKPRRIIRRKNVSFTESDSDYKPRSKKGKTSINRGVDKRPTSNQSRQPANRSKTTTPSTLGSLSSHERRYLDSPFICLCHSSSSTIPTTATLVQPPIGSDTGPDNQLGHIVNPAFLGRRQNAIESSSASAVKSLPNGCPLAHKLPSSNGLLGDDDDHEPGESADSFRSQFAGLTYRPAGQFRSKESLGRLDTNRPIEAANPWLCCFCGESNECLELGGLYGPYWLQESELTQLPPNMIAVVDLTSNNVPSNVKSVMPSSPRGKIRAKVCKPGRGGAVITSTLTRSAVAQGRPSAAQAAAATQSSPNTGSPSPRISANGELWSHLQCMLWAPGTYLHGNGVVGGLGSALQSTLEVTCSQCQKPGAGLYCYTRGCNLAYHYSCALLADCKLDHDQFTVLCKKHHIYS